MAQALPIHIIDEIERRWQRRLDAYAHFRLRQNDDYEAEPGCPLCNTLVAIEPVRIGVVSARRDRVCSRCGHAWRDDVQ